MEDGVCRRELGDLVVCQNYCIAVIRTSLFGGDSGYAAARTVANHKQRDLRYF